MQQRKVKYICASMCGLGSYAAKGEGGREKVICVIVVLVPDERRECRYVISVIKITRLGPVASPPYSPSLSLISSITEYSAALHLFIIDRGSVV